jgi:hypothetical protein
MLALCGARLVVGFLPFGRWRGLLGSRPGPAPDRSTDDLAAAKAGTTAAHVEWAAARLPFDTKCLPRAMALSWLLRRGRIRHAVVFAVRPADLRTAPDALHAWVEVAGAKVLGDLPGPWVETLRLGE